MQSTTAEEEINKIKTEVEEEEERRKRRIGQTKSQVKDGILALVGVSRQACMMILMQIF
jgi:hypothetical protein